MHLDRPWNSTAWYVECAQYKLYNTCNHFGPSVISGPLDSFVSACLRPFSPGRERNREYRVNWEPGHQAPATRDEQRDWNAANWDRYNARSRRNEGKGR